MTLGSRNLPLVTGTFGPVPEAMRSSPRVFFMASFRINGFLIYYVWIVGESAGGYGFRRPNSGSINAERERSRLLPESFIEFTKTKLLGAGY